MSLAPHTASDGRTSAGLRPGLVFLGIGAVLALVALRSTWIALAEDGEQPRNLRRLPVVTLSADLCDAAGVPLATSAEVLELVASPNALWQAHTPGTMARKLADALGQPGRADELLARLLPAEARGGWIRCERAPLVLDAACAARVQAWIATGGAEVDPVPVQGFRLVAGAPGTYHLAWQPVVALSEAERARHGAERPRDWTRRIAEDLAACLDAAAAYARDDEEAADRRDAIWRALLPSQFRIVTKEVPPARAPLVHQLLQDERVQPLQMEMRRSVVRAYPVRGGEGGVDVPFAVLGRWATLDVAAARKRAAQDLRLPGDEAAWTAEQRTDVDARAGAYVWEPTPQSGLELLAANVLARPQQAWVARRGEEYTFLQNQAPRRPLARYFQELVPADPVPRVVTTLEAGLQRCMRAELESIVREHRPALAQAIALDVATGDVLAVDALDAYGIGGFAPTMHTFTPGSTFKVAIMASALESGAITLADEFDSQNGKFAIEGRSIREAEGGDDKGRVDAAHGLAYSINAVLVQIGTRVPAEILRAHLAALGYGEYPGSGLGFERCGTLRPLPWKTKYTHASVSFGHELFVTLWQHAQALATIARGGRFRPLRLVQAVESGGRREAIPLVLDHRLQARDAFSAATCASVRDMMRLGAEIGTGRTVCADLFERIDVGTKTGTAQKVPGELCLHLELQHNREHGCRGARACRALLARSGRPPHRTCYTSSMCAVGRLRSGGREVLVLVVVDEPRSRVHFGSQVAGPAAIAILREALGDTRGGCAPIVADGDGFRALDGAALHEGSDKPWSEDADASR